MVCEKLLDSQQNFFITAVAVVVRTPEGFFIETNICLFVNQRAVCGGEVAEQDDLLIRQFAQNHVCFLHKDSDVAEVIVQETVDLRSYRVDIV